MLSRPRMASRAPRRSGAAASGAGPVARRAPRSRSAAAVTLRPLEGRRVQRAVSDIVPQHLARNDLSWRSEMVSSFCSPMHRSPYLSRRTRRARAATSGDAARQRLQRLSRIALAQGRHPGVAAGMRFAIRISISVGSTDSMASWRRADPRRSRRSRLRRFGRSVLRTLPGLPAQVEVVEHRHGPAAE